VINKIIKHINKGQKRSVKAKKNILYSFGIKGVSILTALIYVPILLDYLDQERYGIWLTLASIIQWVGYFDLGLGHGLRNRLTESIANGTSLLSRKLISTTYALFILIFGAILILISLIFPFLDWTKILNTDVIAKQELMIIALVVGVNFCFRFVLNIITKVLFAFQRPAIANLFEPLGQVLALIVILILVNVTEKGSLLILSIILSSKSVIVLSIATFFLFKKKYKDYKPSLSFVDFTLVKNILGLGVRFFYGQLGGLFVFSSANFIITQILGPAEVTSYQIAYKYFSIAIMVSAIVMSPIWSAVTDAFTLNDYNWLKKTLKTLIIISVVFAFGIIVMLLISPFAYELWVGDRVVIPWDLSVSLAIFSILTVVLTPFTNFINGLGKLKLGNLIVLPRIILFLIIAIGLTKTSLGSVGIVIALCFTQALGLVLGVIQVNKLLNRKAIGIWNK